MHVYTDTFDEKDSAGYWLILISRLGDVVSCPHCYWQLYDKLAGGIADDMITTTLLALQLPYGLRLLWIVHMYENRNSFKKNHDDIENR